MTGPRVLVVGAGHNGLVCAALLARKGADVVVLEQAPAPGGAVTSGQDTLPGFLHDRCAAFFPSVRVSPVFRDLALEQDGLEWVVPDVAMAHPFADGSSICLSRDVGATAASLDRAAAGAGEAWRRIYELLTPHRELLLRAGLSGLPPALPVTRLALTLRRDGLELVRLMIGSAATLGREVLGGDRAAAWIAGSAGHSDLTPGASGSAAIGLFLNMLGHWVGWPFPRGGAGRITELLTGRMTRYGGAIRCGAPVEHVVRHGRRAVGVVLRGGEELRADAIVVTVSPRPLAAMLDPDALPPRVLGQLRRWRYEVGTVKVDFALSGAVPWRAIEARRAAVVHLGGELAELEQAAVAARRGEVPANLPLVVGQQSVFDPTRAPAGRHTLYAYGRITPEPSLTDDQLAGIVQERIEAFAPGFGALVLARAVRSPRRIELENPSLVAGDLAAGSLALDQLGPFRPAPQLARWRTPLRGLYVAGAAVHPGPAVHGVSGAGAARAVLRDAAERRWRRRALRRAD